jgi:hypothetical protein
MAKTKKAAKKSPSRAPQSASRSRRAPRQRATHHAQRIVEAETTAILDEFKRDAKPRFPSARGLAAAKDTHRATRPQFPPPAWSGAPRPGDPLPTPGAPPAAPPGAPATSGANARRQISQRGAPPVVEETAADELLDQASASVAGDVPGEPDESGDLTRTLLGPDAVSPATDALRMPYTLDDQVGLEDVDQLFQWSRVDAEGAQAFLGFPAPRVSLHLMEWFSRLSILIDRGQAALFAIRHLDALAGFIMLLPIVRTPKRAPVGTVHVYIESAARGDISAIARALVRDADRVAPGMDLFAAPPRAEWGTVLAQAGFTAQTVYKRKSTVGEEPIDGR